MQPDARLAQSRDARGDSAALPEGDRTLTDALDLIDRFVERIMPTHGMPGLALAITDRDGLLATRNYGYADLAALTPVDDETLFQHGSIGKHSPPSACSSSPRRESSISTPP